MELVEICRRAKDVKYEVQKLSTQAKNKALISVADALVKRTDFIIEANRKDYDNGLSNGMHQGMLDRLKLDGKRIEAMAEGLRQVAELEDPIGTEIEHFVRPNGLEISKVRVPFGVIGIIYESRPNVTADAFGLTFKSGNAVILKGGSDAINSNIAITTVIRDALKEENINPDAVQLIEATDRAVTTQFMQMKEYVDVLIPRGSARLRVEFYSKVLSEGDQTSAQPTVRSIITAHYTGRTINGKKFDSSRGGVPLACRLCDLIEGWIIAIQQMHVGDKWELYIPAEMGYGKFSQPGIPGGSTLIFEIELLGIS